MFFLQRETHFRVSCCKYRKFFPKVGQHPEKILYLQPPYRNSPNTIEPETLNFFPHIISLFFKIICIFAFRNKKSVIMGMVLNRFAMLKQLRNDIKYDGYYSRKFKLSAVIVHDPNDRELVNCVSQNFVRWAEMTGKNFLFISFVEPSTEWKRSSMASDRYSVNKDYLLTDNDFTHENEETTNPLLREFMGLPPAGSYLMLTNDLCSNTFHKVSISTNSLEHCLLQITDYCDDEAHGIDHGPGDFNSLLDNLNADEYSHSNTFIDALLDLTSMFSKADNDYELSEQKDRAKKVIQRLKEQLECASDEDYEEKLFRLYESIRYFSKLQRPLRFKPRGAARPTAITHFECLQHSTLGYITSDSYSNYSSEPDSTEWLDEYSQKLLKSHDEMKKIIFSSPDLDYSGLTIYLGKIVENETNLSIGQLLRYVMGIDMPEYYNKYCADMRNVSIPAGNTYINMNQFASWECNYDKAPLKSVPMGSLVYAYSDMYGGQRDYPCVPLWNRFEELTVELIDFLLNFSINYRNLAAHIDHDSSRTYFGAKHAFDEFMDHFLPELYHLKQKLTSRY